MDAQNDRPGKAMADIVEAGLRLAEARGIRYAAREMVKAGVPLHVAARVLCMQSWQRRPPSIDAGAWWH